MTDPLWPSSNVAALRALCLRLGIEVRDLVAIMAHESGCMPNPPHNGPARGLIQFEPETLHGLGWKGSPDEWVSTHGVAEQLDYVERYYAPYARAGILKGGVGPLYVATFLPALLAHAQDPSFVLCGVRGPFAWAYFANKVFDTQGKGNITVEDMATAAERAVQANRRAQAILAELDAIESVPALAVDVTDGGQDVPVYVAEPEEEAG